MADTLLGASEGQELAAKSGGNNSGFIQMLRWFLRIDRAHRPVDGTGDEMRKEEEAEMLNMSWVEDDFAMGERRSSTSRGSDVSVTDTVRELNPMIEEQAGKEDNEPAMEDSHWSTSPQASSCFQSINSSVDLPLPSPPSSSTALLAMGSQFAPESFQGSDYFPREDEHHVSGIGSSTPPQASGTRTPLSVWSDYAMNAEALRRMSRHGNDFGSVA